MRELVPRILSFLIGISLTLFFVTADHVSWSLWAASPPVTMRGTVAQDVLEDHTPTSVNIVTADALSCVHCCVPVHSESQEPCLLACVYDEGKDIFRYLRPSDVVKE